MLRNEINIRDPFVLVENGKYYLYGTRGAACWGKADGFDVYVSEDLVHWEGPHVCFHNDGTFWADRNYWAPEVHPWQGKYYMFARAGLLRLTGSAWMAPSMQARTESPIWCFAMNGFRRGMGKCALYL